jgi:serine/threonine protein kinase
MNKYKIIEQLGDGSFGSVLKAQNMESSTIVLPKLTQGLHG